MQSSLGGTILTEPVTAPPSPAMLLRPEVSNPRGPSALFPTIQETSGTSAYPSPVHSLPKTFPSQVYSRPMQSSLGGTILTEPVTAPPSPAMLLRPEVSNP